MHWLHEMTTRKALCFLTGKDSVGGSVLLEDMDNEKNLPLHLAIQNGNLSLANFCMDKGKRSGEPVFSLKLESKQSASFLYLLLPSTDAGQLFWYSIGRWSTCVYPLHFTGFQIFVSSIYYSVIKYQRAVIPILTGFDCTFKSYSITFLTQNVNCLASCNFYSVQQACW